MSNGQAALVIGASGAIGSAVVQHFLGTGREVIAVSRSAVAHEAPALRYLPYPTEGDDEQRIQSVVEQLAEMALTIDRVVVSIGLLHAPEPEAVFPEKRLEQLSAHQLTQVLHTNTVLPGLWAARLLPLLKTSQHCVYATLSARVGSIGDNRLGGWYSYRSSKAALNMLLQTAAIEYRRRAPGVKLLAFHPGTTDSELSAPFQARVPEDKLFQPAFVAERLASVMEELQADGVLSFLDWRGERVAW